MVLGFKIRHRGRPGVRALVRLLVLPLTLALGAVTSAEEITNLRADFIGLRSLERSLPRGRVEVELPPDVVSPQSRWTGQSNRFFDAHFLPSLYDELRNETDFARGFGKATGEAAQNFLLEQTFVLRLRDRMETKWTRQFGRQGTPPVGYYAAQPTIVSGRPRPTSDFEVGLSGSGPELGWAYRRGPTSFFLSVDAGRTLALEYRSGNGQRARSLNADLDPVRGRYHFHLRFGF